MIGDVDNRVHWIAHDAESMHADFARRNVAHFVAARCVELASFITSHALTRSAVASLPKKSCAKSFIKPLR
jgi:hypothetical protein